MAFTPAHLQNSRKKYNLIYILSGMFLAFLTVKWGRFDLPFPILVPFIFFLVFYRLITEILSAKKLSFTKSELNIYGFYACFLTYYFVSLFIFDSEFNLELIFKVVFGCALIYSFNTASLNYRILIDWICISQIILVAYIIYHSFYILGASYVVNDLQEVTQAGRNQVSLHLVIYYSLIMPFVFSNYEKNKKLYMLASVVLLMGVFLTFSRSAFFISFIVLFVTLFLVGKVDGKILISIVVASIISFNFLIFYLDLDIQDFLSRYSSVFVDSYGSSSIELRSLLIRDGLNLFYENFILGIGEGGFVNKYEYVTHNEYLKYLVEGGLVGFSVMMMPLLYIKLKFIRYYINNRMNIDSVVLSSFISFFAMLIIMFYVNIDFSPIYFFVVGMCVRSLK